MFDDPGKKLHQLEEELRAVEPVEIAEESSEDYENDLADGDAVWAPEPERAGLRTLVLLGLFILGCLAAARWCFGWI